MLCFVVSKKANKGDSRQTKNTTCAGTSLQICQALLSNDVLFSFLFSNRLSLPIHSHLPTEVKWVTNLLFYFWSNRFFPTLRGSRKCSPGRTSQVRLFQQVGKVGHWNDRVLCSTPQSQRFAPRLIVWSVWCDLKEFALVSRRAALADMSARMLVSAALFLLSASGESLCRFQAFCKPPAILPINVWNQHRL